MDNARQTALNILIEYDKLATFPNLSLKKHLRRLDSKRDCSFITALVYGVIEKRITLDYYISKVSSVKLKKINVCVLNILRLGLYQIIYMDTPVSAACNTSVELAKHNKQFKSAGFVNAILRRLSSIYTDFEFDTKNVKEYLSLKYSVGNSVINKLYSIFGDDTEKFFTFTPTKDLFIAVNTQKLSADELIIALALENITAQKTSIDGLLKIESGGFDIENLSAYKFGLFHVVGFASFAVAKLLHKNGCKKIIDMCASPGGKTFAVAYFYDNNTKICAFDLHEHKVQNLKSSCKRLGLANVEVSQGDGTELNDKLLNTADLILCDVPCSGLGVIHSKPDIKYNDIDFDSLTKTQSQILHNASKYLKSGGRLVYSTCTINPDENENVVIEFLKQNPDFEFENENNLYNHKNTYTFLPHIDNTDGFFYAVLTKK